MNATQLRERLQAQGFRAVRNPDWFDLRRSDEGFIRVDFPEGDETVKVYRFNRSEILQWKLDLSFYLPTSVFEASLQAAIQA